MWSQVLQHAIEAESNFIHISTQRSQVFDVYIYDVHEAQFQNKSIKILVETKMFKFLLFHRIKEKLYKQNVVEFDLNAIRSAFEFIH